MPPTDPSTRAWSLSTWLSAASLAFGSFALVSSELMPMGLLTPLARDLGISEGAAGQAVTLTAVFAGFAAPTTALVVGRLDRKLVMLALCVLVIAANVTAAFAWNYWSLLGARILLGVALGGFFALAGATVVRIVSMNGFGRGMAVLFLGVSVATVAAPPLAALVAAAYGWRAAFLVAAGAGLTALVVQALCLPRVPAASATTLGALLSLLGRPAVRVGLLAALLLVGGHFAGFTFLRPHLEAAAGLDAAAVAAVLLVYGIANLLGAALAGAWADKALRGGFIATGLLMGGATLGMAILGGAFAPALAFAAVWGLGFGAAPVMIQTWMGRAAPDQLEGVGGLFLAGLQFAIALGAGAGGLAVDRLGASAPIGITAACGVLAAVLIAARRSPAGATVEAQRTPAE